MFKTIAIIYCFLLSPFFLFAQPVISTFNPTQGSAGTIVTITGSNFSPTASNNVVYFGAVPATVTSASATTLTVVAPAQASYHPISVTTGNLTSYSNKPFLITFSGGGEIHQGTFDFKTFLDQTSSNVSTNDIKAWDLNSDSKPDIIVVDRTNNKLSIYRNTSSTSTFSFAAKIDYTTGTNPTRISIGDFDCDGKPDIIVNNSGDNSISVFRNTTTSGNISFAGKLDFATATQPDASTIQDFDGDGKLDIIVASIDFNGTLSLLRNTTIGNVISFAPKVEMTVSGPLNNIASGDLNSDNKADVVLSNFGSNRLIILKNLSTIGNINFTIETYINSNSYPEGLQIADLNGDNKLDILSTKSNATLSVYRNISGSTISFDPGNDFYSGDNPTDLGVTEVDGDGKPDVVVLNVYNSATVLKNNSATGYIYLVWAAAIPASNAGERLTLGDFNGDGKCDLSFNGVYRGSICQNRIGLPYISSFTPSSGSQGTSITITGYHFTGATSVTFGGVAAASFTVNNSNSITAIVASGATGNVVVNTPLGSASKSGFSFYSPPIISSFSPTSTGSGGYVTITGQNFTGATLVSFGGVSATSFNVVNATTISAIVSSGASGNVQVTTPGGTASKSGFTFIPAPNIISFTPSNAGTNAVITISGTDFTGATTVSFGSIKAKSFIVNSPTTISATLAGGASGVVKVVTPYGQDTLGGFMFVPLPAPTVVNLSTMSGDAGSTLVITGRNFNQSLANNIVYFGSVKATLISCTSSEIRCSVPYGSINAPVTVVNKENGLSGSSKFAFTTTFNGTSELQYSLAQNFDVGLGGRSIAVGDLNNDKKLDILFGNSGGEINVFRNTHTANILSFERTDIPLGGFQAGDIAVHDFDADGLQDFAVIVNGLMVFRNTTTSSNTITFAPYISYATGYSPYGIAVADIDADGKPEIITANNSGNSVSIFQNASLPGQIAFKEAQNFPAGITPTSICIGDFDDDGRIDIAVCNEANQISILKNNTTDFNISFSIALTHTTGTSPVSISSVDLDGDNKLDLAVSNSKQNSISVFRNTNSSVGTISFAPKQDFSNSYIVASENRKIVIHDLNGDKKPEVLVAHQLQPGTVGPYRNFSSPGAISLINNAGNNFIAYDRPSTMVVGDLNNDGRPDIAAANLFSYMSVLLNECFPTFASACVGGTTSFTSNVTGSYYQWQISTGSGGFINLSNDANYSGVGSSTLTIQNISAAWYNYEYRCIVQQTHKSNIMKFRFTNNWIGTVNGAWENPSNWSCGIVPDSNTDVIINSGSVTINSNISVRSLTINAAVNVNVNAGYTLTVLK